MKVKVSELTGAALDYAVAMCEDIAKFSPLASSKYHFAPSKSWQQGGPIIEQEKISVEILSEGDGWCACVGCTPHDFLMWDQPYASELSICEGPTPLIAAMRCYVASKLGEEIEISEELI